MRAPRAHPGSVTVTIIIIIIPLGGLQLDSEAVVVLPGRTWGACVHLKGAYYNPLRPLSLATSED